MNDNPAMAAQAIEAGAKGYITKNDDPALLPGAVKSVAEGGVYLRPEIAGRRGSDQYFESEPARSRDPPLSGGRSDDSRNRQTL
jgi:DNA-binding NarL/FixJ family response regulator